MILSQWNGGIVCGAVVLEKSRTKSNAGASCQIGQGEKS